MSAGEIERSRGGGGGGERGGSDGSGGAEGEGELAEHDGLLLLGGCASHILDMGRGPSRKGSKKFGGKSAYQEVSGPPTPILS